MRPLRGLSSRPELIVDERGRRVVDPSGGHVGIPGPFGRGRMVTALPVNKTGPVQLRPPELIIGPTGFLLGSPDGTVVGVAGLWCHRIVTATVTSDTRRLSGQSS